jgi:hypothetical protein
MPLQVQVNHPDRMVVGVASGAVTIEDLHHFVEELGRAQAYRYRKLVDLMGGTWALTDEEVEAFCERVRNTPPDRRSGPIALVTTEASESFARMFTELTGGKRPVKIFSSIHPARIWLRQNSLVEY